MDSMVDTGKIVLFIGIQRLALGHRVEDLIHYKCQHYEGNQLATFTQDDETNFQW